MFTCLKCKPKSAFKTVNNYNEGIKTTEEQPRPTKPSYTQAPKADTNTFLKNLTSQIVNKLNKNINEKLNHSAQPIVGQNERLLGQETT